MNGGRARIDGDARSRAHLSANLRYARSRLGLSQQQLAERCAFKRTYIGALERGELNAGLDNVDKLARGLGLRMPVLLMPPDEAAARMLNGR